jgi:hypothetical protein
MAHAARCGDGVIVLLAQGDPPHPKAGTITSGPGRRIVLETAERQPVIESDQAPSSQTVTPTTTDLVDHELSIRHIPILPADYICRWARFEASERSFWVGTPLRIDGPVVAVVGRNRVLRSSVWRS